MAKKQKRKVTRGERLLYQTALMCFICTVILEIFCGANVGNLNITVEKLKYEVNEQEKQNESLTMKVNELTAFSNVKDVVKDMGLAYNYDNIINIGE